MYPDVRKIIDRLQKFSVNGVLDIDKQAVVTQENILVSKFIEIIQNVLQGTIAANTKLIQVVIDTLNQYAYEIDYRKVFEDLFSKDKVPPFIKIKVNQYANNHKSCLSPSMNFLSLLFESIDSTKHYMDLVNQK
jgi:hypothetical protein